MIRDFLNKVFKREQDGHGSMLHKSAFLFGVKSLSALLGLVILMLLSNVLGAEELGHYQYAFTWTSVLSLVAVCGFDRLMVREFSRLRSDGLPGVIRSFFRLTNNWILISSCIVFALAFAASYLPFEIFEDYKTVITYRLALGIIPLTAFLTHRRSALNGIREVVISQFPEKLAHPAIMLLVLFGIWLFSSTRLNAEVAIGVNLLSWSGALLYGHLLWVKHRPKVQLETPELSRKKMWWRQAAMILLFNLSMVIFARIDILMLRPMQDSDAVGMYSIPFKLASYLNFILIAINSVMAPSISQYFHEGKRKELQHMVTQAVRASMLFALPIGLVLIFGADFIVPYFGDDFVTVGFALIVLVIGQLVNIACGPVGNLLIMTNQETAASLVYVFSTLVNIGLNLWLIPIMSFEGAAIATAVSVALTNILMLVFVVAKLKINPTIFRF